MNIPTLTSSFLSIIFFTRSVCKASLIPRLFSSSYGHKFISFFPISSSASSKDNIPLSLGIRPLLHCLAASYIILSQRSNFLSALSPFIFTTDLLVFTRTISSTPASVNFCRIISILVDFGKPWYRLTLILDSLFISISFTIDRSILVLSIDSILHTYSCLLESHTSISSPWPYLKTLLMCLTSSPSI